MTIDDSTKANIDVKGMHKVKSGITDDRKLQVDMSSVFHLRSTNAEKKYQIVYVTGPISNNIFRVEDELGRYRMGKSRSWDTKTVCQLLV